MSEFHIKIDGSNLVINIYDLLGEATGEERATLIDALACREEVVDEVMNQVFDGWTTLMSHGPRGSGGDPDSRRGIDWARMRIAKESSAIAAAELEAAKQMIDRERESARKAWDQYHELLSGKCS